MAKKEFIYEIFKPASSLGILFTVTDCIIDVRNTSDQKIKRQFILYRWKLDKCHSKASLIFVTIFIFIKPLYIKCRKIFALKQKIRITKRRRKNKFVADNYKQNSPS